MGCWLEPAFAHFSINSALTGSSGSIKLRYKKCLVNWGNAILPMWA